MRVMITGDKGFIGGNLKEALNNGLFAQHFAIKDDIEIVSLPCDSRGIDIKNTKVKLDRIYHLAGTPSPAKYKNNPGEVLLSSVFGMFNILELAKKTGARVLFTSTVNTDKYYPPTDSRSCYVDGKKAAEDLCEIYRKTVDVRVVRLFSSYGVGMKPDDGRVIPQFIVNALQNKPLKIYGDGSQLDSFCYVTDTIHAMYELMEHENPGHAVEIGNPNIVGAKGLTSIKELAEKVIEICGSKSTIEHMPYSGFDKERVPNIHYLSSVLNWHPRVSLAEGLKKTINAFREVIQ